MEDSFLDRQRQQFDAYSEHIDAGESTASRLELDAVVRFIGNDLVGKKVLDLGCGVGRFGVRLAQRTGADVTGVDISTSSIAKANDLAREAGVTNFHATLGDFKDPNLVDQFDFVLCINMLHHTNERHLIAENIHRALKPGGYWIIVENNPANPLFIPFFVMIKQLRAHLTVEYLKVNKYSLRGLIRQHSFTLVEVHRHGFLPTLLYNYSLHFVTLNRILNRIPIVNELAAFHFLKAVKPISPSRRP